MATMNTSPWHRHFNAQARYHAWAAYHQGQITAVLTAMDQPCTELDMVYFLLAEQAAKA